MKIIAHIGTPKTGTTSIQQVLNANRDHLHSFGYHYLASMGVSNHVAFPRCFYSKFRPTDEYCRIRRITTPAEFEEHRAAKLRELEDELASLPAGTHTVVTSCEHFYSRLNTAEEIAALAGFLDRHFSHVEIVVYLRNQPELLTSLYSTVLKADGEISGLHEFTGKVCRESNPYFNFHLGLGRWRDQFGDDALSARLFARDEFIDGDLLSDFFGRIDPVLLPGLLRPGSNHNESMTHLGQVIARSVNAVEPRYIEGAGSNKENRRWISRIAEAFRRTGQQLPEDVYQRIVDEFRASNENLRKELFPGRDTLFPGRKQADPNEGRMLTSEQEMVLSSLIGRSRGGRRKSHPKGAVRVLRDAAAALEGTDLKQAYQLMKLASALKPEGDFIKRKLLAYEKKLGADASPSSGSD
ncbi:MAG: hypothetical protein KDN05_02045 [Verrucomicrobiae bacterium]|nr:hypothetical protein [Verrucomicrobiae bacterium]MCP5533549.1 hypothetical protein [Akkermansiaceae bacterium]MCP5542489.1 hypothetical protein [Akkermansiaceae bacterium]MCP5545976.1 hypothetical protein [Akkermansiaceae bacterium]